MTVRPLVLGVVAVLSTTAALVGLWSPAMVEGAGPEEAMTDAGPTDAGPDPDQADVLAYYVGAARAVACARSEAPDIHFQIVPDASDGRFDYTASLPNGYDGPDVSEVLGRCTRAHADPVSVANLERPDRSTGDAFMAEYRRAEACVTGATEPSTIDDLSEAELQTIVEGCRG